MSNEELCAKAYAAGMSLGVIAWLEGDIREVPAHEVSAAAERFFPVKRPDYPYRIRYYGGEFHYDRIETPQPASPPQKRRWWTRLFHRLSSEKK